MTERTHRGRAKRGPSQSPRGVRIIAGQWRGRRIPVAPATALRPTPDRVRETLFNWLMPTLVGSDCLDLFAGSGVLGWEALSRGAAQVCFVERDRAALQALKDQKAVFAAAAADIVAGDAEVFLKSAPRLFDVIFLDPPYDEPAEPWLEQLWSAWLAPSGCIYVERDSASALDVLERFGHFRRRGRAAGVHYGLLEHRIERQD